MRNDSSLCTIAKPSSETMAYKTTDVKKRSRPSDETQCLNSTTAPASASDMPGLQALQAVMHCTKLESLQGGQDGRCLPSLRPDSQLAYDAQMDLRKSSSVSRAGGDRNWDIEDYAAPPSFVAPSPSWMLDVLLWRWCVRGHTNHTDNTKSGTRSQRYTGFSSKL